MIEDNQFSLLSMLEALKNMGPAEREFFYIRKNEIRHTYDEQQLAEIGKVIPLGQVATEVRIDHKAGRFKAWPSTVTYLKRDDNNQWAFGASAHSQPEIDNGIMMNPDIEVRVYGANVQSVDKERAELLVERTPIEPHTPYMGIVEAGSTKGHFGQFAPPPEDIIALQTTVGVPKIGPAKLRTTIDDNGVQDYNINITSVYTNGEGKNNINFEFNDRRLITKLGEKVAMGMSGSPIIQRGKLVAAISYCIEFENGIIINGGLWAADMIKEHQRVLSKEFSRNFG